MTIKLSIVLHVASIFLSGKVTNCTQPCVFWTNVAWIWRCVISICNYLVAISVPPAPPPANDDTRAPWDDIDSRLVHEFA